VISVSPVSDGPFGQVLRYGPGDGRVNALIHELPPTMRGSIHELSTDVDAAWITLWMLLSQPPIANISTRGRSEVAAVRRSE
jgi:hypothetical protein